MGHIWIHALGHPHPRGSTRLDRVLERVAGLADGDWLGASWRERAADTGGAGRAADGELYPDVIAATATRDADGTWQVTATLSSPYDSAERYADAWRVLAPNGTELGIRELTHDHAGEQPFTRSLAGVEIPAGVDVVTVEGRDQISGWGGTTVDVELQP